MQFDEFEIDPRAGELRRAGTRVKLQDLPFRMLVELAARPGEVVSREELRAKLWGADTFVDAEAGLNTAIAKLREALGDSAERPRFVETIPKRGYRFIARPAFDAPAAPALTPAVARRAGPGRVLVLALLTIGIVAAGTFAFSEWRARQSVTRIAIVLFHNETGDASLDPLAQRLTDATVVALTANQHYGIIGNAAILRTPRIFADLQNIAATLHAEYVLIAQLQQSAAGLVVRAHFIRGSDQVHLWAKEIAGDSGAIDTRVVDVIRTGIADALAGRR